VNLCIGCLEKDPEDTQKRIDSVLKKAEKYKIYVDIPYENKHVKPEEKVPYRHVTIDGWDIYIGKNDAQNDELTTKFAKPWDLWFHVAIHSGSHVIIKMERNGPRPPNAVIEKVAALTVWFSKAKHTSLSEVHMTEARFVRKPRKYPPGKVIVERCKAIRVSPISPQAMFRDYKEEAE
jgi:predicted ribosome quality control (RQC) complex YloA/Tae2 family protein